MTRVFEWPIGKDSVPWYVLIDPFYSRFSR